MKELTRPGDRDVRLAEVSDPRVELLHVAVGQSPS